MDLDPNIMTTLPDIDVARSWWGGVGGGGRNELIVFAVIAGILIAAGLSRL